MMNSQEGLASLSCPELLARTRELLRKSHDIEAELLVHLGEIDERKVYLDSVVLHLEDTVLEKRIEARRASFDDAERPMQVLEGGKTRVVLPIGSTFHLEQADLKLRVTNLLKQMLVDFNNSEIRGGSR